MLRAILASRSPRPVSLFAKAPCGGLVHRAQQSSHVLPRQRPVRALKLQLRRRDYGIGQSDRNAPRDEQKPAERTNTSGAIRHARTRKTLCAFHQKTVDVRERHCAPGLAVPGKVFQKPPDMVQPLPHGHSGVAAMPDEMVRILLQQR
jgi:hypothetical protein